MAVVHDILVSRTLLVGEPIQPVLTELTQEVSAAFESAFPELPNYTVTVAPSAQLRSQVSGEQHLSISVVVDDGVVPGPEPDTAFGFCGDRFVTIDGSIIVAPVLSGGSIV